MSIERYATESVAPLERIRRWCQFGSNTLSELSVHPYQPAAFNAQLLRSLIGDFGVTLIQTTPAHAVSRGGRVGAWASGDQGSVDVLLQKTGKSRHVQFGREAVLYPGDVVIRDLRRPWEHDAAQNSTFFSVKVAVARLSSVLPDFESDLAVRLPADEGRTLLLASIVESVHKLAFRSTDEVSAGAVGDLVLGAIQVAYRRATDACEVDTDVDHSRGELFQMVDECVLDPTTSVAVLATRLGISVRSLQRIFYRKGTTPRDYILARRIEKASEQLRGLPAHGARRITQIALASGFNDPAYFSRAFLQHTGMTPSEYVRRHRKHF